MIHPNDIQRLAIAALVASAFVALRPSSANAGQQVGCQGDLRVPLVAGAMRTQSPP